MPSLHRRAIALTAACMFALTGCASAQDNTPSETLSVQQARADLDRLYSGLRAAEADLFEATPEAVFDARHAELRASFNADISLGALHADLQRFAALARHAHTRIEGLNPDWAGFAAEDGRVFPLRFRIENGEVIISAAPAGSGVAPGDRLLALDGEPNPVWLARLTRNISAETAEFAYAQLSLGEFYYVWLEYGSRDRFSVDVEQAGERRTVTLDAIALEDVLALTPPRAGVSLDGRAARMLDDRVAYLRPGPFWNIDAETPDEQYAPEALAAYKEFIDSAFESFIEESADHLVLDLRDNPGGDNSFSDPVVAWFADEPFRFASQFLIRVSQETIASNQARLDAMDDPDGSVSQAYAKLFESAPEGELIEYELPFVEPEPGPRFAGEVHVLVNRNSYSNAVTTAALIQDYGFGTVYGEPTRDMATIFGSMENFTLPRSGFLVGYPKALIIRPNGEPTPHPLTPDIPLPSGDPNSETDIMLDALKARLTER